MMTEIRLQVLPTVRFGALVDLSLLRAHNEEMLVVLVEIKAAASSQAREVHFFRVIPSV